MGERDHPLAQLPSSPSALCPPPKARRPPPRPQWPTAHRLCRPPGSLHLALCPLTACSLLWLSCTGTGLAARTAPHRTTAQSKAKQSMPMAHGAAPDCCTPTPSWFGLSLPLSCCRPLFIFFSLLPNLPLPSSTAGLYTALGSLFSTIPHELFVFMISFIFHPCPRHSSLFVPQGAPRLVLPLRPSKSRTRPREPTPILSCHTNPIAESRPQTSCYNPRPTPRRALTIASTHVFES